MSMLTLWVWFVVLPYFSSLGAGLFGFGLAGAFCSACAIAIVSDCAGVARSLALYDRVKVYIITLLILGSLFSMAPNEKQAMLLAGGYAVTNSKEISALPENIAKAANAYLGELAKSEEPEPTKAK